MSVTKQAIPGTPEFYAQQQRQDGRRRITMPEGSTRKPESKGPFQPPKKGNGGGKPAPKGAGDEQQRHMKSLGRLLGKPMQVLMPDGSGVEGTLVSFDRFTIELQVTNDEATREKRVTFFKHALAGFAPLEEGGNE